MTKFNYSDIWEGICTLQEYACQFPSVTSVLGETYCYAPNDFQGGKVTIVFVNDKIAVGLKEPKWGEKEGQYCLYYSNGPFAGFKYQDTARPFYRLQEVQQ